MEFEAVFLIEGATVDGIYYDRKAVEQALEKYRERIGEASTYDVGEGEVYNCVITDVNLSKTIVKNKLCIVAKVKMSDEDTNRYYDNLYWDNYAWEADEWDF